MRGYSSGKMPVSSCREAESSRTTLHQPTFDRPFICCHWSLHRVDLPYHRAHWDSWPYTPWPPTIPHLSFRSHPLAHSASLPFSFTSSGQFLQRPTGSQLQSSTHISTHSPTCRLPVSGLCPGLTLLPPSARSNAVSEGLQAQPWSDFQNSLRIGGPPSDLISQNMIPGVYECVGRGLPRPHRLTQAESSQLLQAGLQSSFQGPLLLAHCVG